MRLLLLAAAGVLLSSCAAQHQLTPQRPPKSDVVGLLSPANATASTLAPPLGFDVQGKTKAQSERKAARILRHWHRQFQRAAGRTQTVPAAVPRKCKGCTIVYGDATVAGKKATVAAGEGAVASHIEKKAGPAVVGSDSVSQNTLGTGNQAVTNGDGNTTSQTKADVEPPGVGAAIASAIASPVGKAVAVLLLAGAVYGFVVWRKKSVV
jgi:hypothetical protein